MTAKMDPKLTIMLGEGANLMTGFGSMFAAIGSMVQANGNV